MGLNAGAVVGAAHDQIGEGSPWRRIVKAVGDGGSDDGVGCLSGLAESTRRQLRLKPHSFPSMSPISDFPSLRSRQKDEGEMSWLTKVSAPC